MVLTTAAAAGGVAYVSKGNSLVLQAVSVDVELLEQWSEPEADYAVIKVPHRALANQLAGLAAELGEGFALWEALTIQHGDGVELVFRRSRAE